MKGMVWRRRANRLACHLMVEPKRGGSDREAPPLRSSTAPGSTGLRPEILPRERRAEQKRQGRGHAPAKRDKK